MSNETIDPRDYGALEQQVKQLVSDVHSLKTTVETMSLMMSQAQGGWKTMMALSGIAGTIGAAVSWFTTHIKIS